MPTAFADLQIDHELEIRGLLDGQVRRLGALQYLGHKYRAAPRHAISRRIWNSPPASTKGGSTEADGVGIGSPNRRPHLKENATRTTTAPPRSSAMAVNAAAPRQASDHRHRSNLQCRGDRKLHLLEDRPREWIDWVGQNGDTAERWQHIPKRLDTFPAASEPILDKPVIFPPARAGPATRPVRMGSPASRKWESHGRLLCREAHGVKMAATASTLRRTNSRQPAKLIGLCVRRTELEWIILPSDEPSSRNPSRSALPRLVRLIGQDECTEFGTPSTAEHTLRAAEAAKGLSCRQRVWGLAPLSFDHLVGEGEKRGGILRAERLSGPEIDGQLVLGRSRTAR